jgi:iron complex outermembrane recepter protein
MKPRVQSRVQCLVASRATSRLHRTVVASAMCGVAALVASAAQAQSSGDPERKRDTVQVLTGVRVTVDAEDRTRVAPIQFQTLPVSSSVTASTARKTINLVDTQDAVKYLPSVFIRKRNNGDTQATIGTRVWGVGSSARTLVYADGVLLSALIANNNTIGGPRWGMVGPSEVTRIDMMYGPFSAAYAGNSMGAVMEITTRMPTKLEGSLEQTQALQRYAQYGTRASLGTSQTTGSIGTRFGRFSVRASGNYQDSRSQPISFVTASTDPAGTSGAFPAFNRIGAPANVLGASGLLNTAMTNARVKAAYDVTPAVQLAYSFGWWQNDATAGAESYLRSGNAPTFAGAAGFASGTYALLQRHSSHNLSLRSNARKDWDFELVGTQYRFDKDQQRVPGSASATGTTFGQAGRVAVLDGTGWETYDAKVVWHKDGPGARHTVSAGVHQDHYALRNPTFTTAEWTEGASTGTATEGRGDTRTRAAWIQDRWRMTPELTLTFGGRFEQWRAFNGFNANGTTRVTQAEVNDEWFSPKAVLQWTPNLSWTATASVGKAVRFATASELYQLVSTGVTFTSPAPDLRPDNVVATELRLARNFSRGMVQVALFQDNVRDAIISQFLPLAPNSNTLFSYLSNVDRVRARGTEVVFGARDLGVRGVEVNGSVTYLSARILALSGRASATAPADAAIGKFLPNIPEWRGTLAATWTPVQKLGLTLAGRYSGKLFTTLDNADVNPNTWQGFGEWFVADARASYQVDRRWTASFGVDNLLNREYFLFHPFPQRTVVGNVRFAF